ncbi:AIPR family protein [Actinocorallia populi]|uniref:AIPR family protein n=1 Tax=Actinocorallia populi TaxID=2079200 RepID=UPI000D087B4C|nr:AIPR family protein [Actinocorallia populi]
MNYRNQPWPVTHAHAPASDKAYREGHENHHKTKISYREDKSQVTSILVTLLPEAEACTLSILHINQIAAHLKREFLPHLDLSDLQDRSESNPAVLSRALTALGIQALTGFTPQAAAACVIDGFSDNGIDGVAVDDAHERIVLVQTKWHHNGRKNLNQAEALKLRNGAEDLFAARFERFNPRLRALESDLNQALLNTQTKITIALVSTGSDQLGAEVIRPLEDFCDEINSDGEMIDLIVLGTRALHDFIVNGASSRGVDIDVHLTGWGSTDTPYRAYYGVANATQIAEWYEQHGERLFDGNLRDALGHTPVNDDLTATLWNEPEHFWYFNNGITVLAEEVRRSVRDSPNREYGRFSVTGATIVNGAQTAASVRSILRKEPERLGDAKIWVRIISLEGCPDGFGSRVTRATNTQNGVEARDFIALDPRQEMIRAQFRLQFNKTYGLRRSSEPITGDDGCEVDEAAIALACASADPDFAVDAKRQVSSLWSSSEDRVYQALFPENLNVVRMWNSVLVLRAIDERLTALRQEISGRDAGVAVHGNRLIAHLVFSRLSPDVLDDPDATAEGRFAVVGDLTKTMHDQLAAQVAEQHSGAFLGSLFKNHSKCRKLVEDVLAIQTGTFVPTPRVRPKAVDLRSSNARKADAVRVILDEGSLEDGTPLIFRPDTERERRDLLLWISKEPSRGRATWSNDRNSPLTWAVDGERYTPSGLVMRMMVQAGLNPPSGIRGTTRWEVQGKGTLSEIAQQIEAAQDEVVAIAIKWGFTVTKASNQSWFRLEHQDSGQTVYLSRQTKSRSVVVAPETPLDKMRSVVGLDVPAESDYFHDSGLDRFPKRLKSGKRLIHYGYAIKCTDHSAIDGLLRLLTQLATDRDTIEDPPAVHSSDLRIF